MPDDNPWWSQIRKAFDIRDQVSHANAVEIIARQVLEAVPALPSGPGEVPWPEAIVPARQTVADFLAAATAGQFDLPLSGFGSIRNDGGLNHRSAPTDDVVDMMRERSDNWRTAEDQQRVEWLWRKILAQVNPEARLAEVREHGI